MHQYIQQYKNILFNNIVVKLLEVKEHFMQSRIIYNLTEDQRETHGVEGIKYVQVSRVRYTNVRCTLVCYGLAHNLSVLLKFYDVFWHIWVSKVRRSHKMTHDSVKVRISSFTLRP